MWTLVKTLVFTFLAPGSVTVLVPYLLLRDRAKTDWYHPDAALLLGAAAIALGASAYFVCALDFTFKGRGTPAPIDPPRSLVSGRLYRRMRNPMYIGVLLVLVGEAAMFRSVELLVYALAVACLFHAFVVFYEEPALRKKFGASYEEYCKAVPRWIPRRRSGHRS